MTFAGYETQRAGALTAAETWQMPTTVLVHSAPGPLAGPQSPLEQLLLQPVNDVRARHGRPALGHLWDAWSRFPALCTSLPELDPPAPQVPPWLEFVGPVFQRVPASSWRSPWQEDDERPLILVSFSSHRRWDQASRIEWTVTALAEHPYRVLVTRGMANVQGLALPDNAVLVDHVPHAEVLPRATQLVTHAGHGGIVAGLAHGIALVCLPNPGADQPMLGAQVEALGVGRSLDEESATVAQIEKAVAEVVATPSYKARAGHFATRIGRSGGARTAALRLEHLHG